MTKHELKRQAYQDRVARHKAGLCVECDSPPSLNQDGTTGLRCDEHKRKWLVNRSRVSAELKAEIPQTQFRVRRSSEEIDDAHEARCRTAAVAIMPFIRKVKVVTVGTLSREFPNHRRCLETALKLLKIAGEVNYDEHSPYPVKVRVGSMTRVIPKLTGYNNNSTFAPANPRTDPDPASLYGTEHARQF